MLSFKYTTKTGLPLVLINTSGEIIHSGKKCTLCEQALTSKNSVLVNNCRLKMLKAIEEAFSWGEEYITNCPLGLIMFSLNFNASSGNKIGKSWIQVDSAANEFYYLEDSLTNP